MNVLEKAENLKAELDALRPLDAEAEARIMQKFRLDWNYHSNKLEGNSYTYGETKMLLLYGLTAGGKPIRDHEEISGHNEAIETIIEVIKDQTPLTETFIRHLHKLILVKPEWIDAKTADGTPTKRLINIGEYKTEPNHVETVTGEIFYFAEPIETPAKMQELIEWFQQKKGLKETNPIVLAAEFHYKFIRIHPFDDGNGRMARLLMNFILMQNGFPPVIIKDNDKENYIAVLRQADFGILEPFKEYVANNLIHSLDIMIRGAKGENIEEPDDLDKEIALLEKKIRTVGQKVEMQRSKEIILKTFDESITPLANDLFSELRKFDKFYIQYHARIIIDGTAVLGEYSNAPYYAKNRIMELKNYPNEIQIVNFHNEFNQDGYGSFMYETRLTVNFALTKYIIKDKEDRIILQKLYSEKLSQDEIIKIVQEEKRKHLSFIQAKVDEMKQIQ